MSVFVELDGYAVGSDASNWIIYRAHTNKKTGSREWKAEHFFYHLDAALTALLEKYLRGTDCRDAQSLLDAIKGATGRIQAAANAMPRPESRTAVVA